LLNLAITAAIFLVLTFRAWVKFKNFKILWKEMEWWKTQITARKVLKAEKKTCNKSEGRPEL